MGIRYLSVDDIIRDGDFKAKMSTKQIADALSGRTFE